MTPVRNLLCPGFPVVTGSWPMCWGGRSGCGCTEEVKTRDSEVFSDRVDLCACARLVAAARARLAVGAVVAGSAGAVTHVGGLEES